MKSKASYTRMQDGSIIQHPEGRESTIDHHFEPVLRKKVSMNIVECRGQGISVKTVLDGFKKMKTELEALGCEVIMNIDGKPIDSFSVIEMPEKEPTT